VNVSIPRSSLRIQNPRDSPGGPDGGQAHCAHIELQAEGVGCRGDTTANDSGEQTSKQVKLHTSSSSPTQIKMHVCATRRSLCCDKARVHKTTQTNKRARTNALTRKQPRKRASTVTPPESGGVGRVVSLAAPCKRSHFVRKMSMSFHKHDMGIKNTSSPWRERMLQEGAMINKRAWKVYRLREPSPTPTRNSSQYEHPPQEDDDKLCFRAALHTCTHGACSSQ
jgi:hypothetical protein